MKMMANHFASQLRLLRRAQWIEKLQMVEHFVLEEKKDRTRNKRLRRQRRRGARLWEGRRPGPFGDLGDQLRTGFPRGSKHLRTKGNFVSDAVSFYIGSDNGAGGMLQDGRTSHGRLFKQLDGGLKSVPAVYDHQQSSAITFATGAMVLNAHF